jgi:hypothetical protein
VNTVQVRPDCTLVILDEQGHPYAELRPGYEAALGPVLHLYRIGVHGDQPYLLTLRLPTVNALIRKLPIVMAAAKRLQVRAQNLAR